MITPMVAAVGSLIFIALIAAGFVLGRMTESPERRHRRHSRGIRKLQRGGRRATRPNPTKDNDVLFRIVNSESSGSSESS